VLLVELKSEMLKIDRFIIILIILLMTMKSYSRKEVTIDLTSNLIKSNTFLFHDFSDTLIVSNNVVVENYFQFIDSIVKRYDYLTSYKLTEHLLVRANPWIIDTFRNTDYYRMMALDSFVYNQKK